LIGFVFAALIVLVIPGPGVLYIVARSLAQGRRAGLASVVGLALGAYVHVAAAAVGLSAILLASATAFGIVKALGAGYLIYLGIQTLLARRPTTRPEVPVPLPAWRLMMDGVIISVFNPKIAVFFLAFLPQFVDPAAGSAAGQIWLLGLIYVGLALLTDGSYALLAGTVGQSLGRRGFIGSLMQGRLPRYVVGGLYLGLGVNAALTGRRTA
jgi:threonine/homoserine/homoserine lactone efflux protein